MKGFSEIVGISCSGTHPPRPDQNPQIPTTFLVCSFSSYRQRYEMMPVPMRRDHVLHWSCPNGIIIEDRVGGPSRVNISKSMTLDPPPPPHPRHLRLYLLPDYWFTFNDTIRGSPGMVQKLVSPTTKHVGKPRHHNNDKERLRQLHSHWRISRQPPVEEKKKNNTVDGISWYDMTFHLPLVLVLLTCRPSLGPLFLTWTSTSSQATFH